jgi:hypothetical protein
VDFTLSHWGLFNRKNIGMHRNLTEKRWKEGRKGRKEGRKKGRKEGELFQGVLYSFD